MSDARIKRSVQVLSSAESVTADHPGTGRVESLTRSDKGAGRKDESVKSTKSTRHKHIMCDDSLRSLVPRLDSSQIAMTIGYTDPHRNCFHQNGRFPCVPLLIGLTRGTELLQRPEQIVPLFITSLKERLPVPIFPVTFAYLTWLKSPTGTLTFGYAAYGRTEICPRKTNVPRLRDKRAETERLGILRANERLDPVRLERIYQSILRIEKVDNEEKAARVARA
jgi:hypothetical protein